jgi:hypothetical protein
MCGQIDEVKFNWFKILSNTGATTLSITTFSIMTLGIRGLHVTLSTTAHSVTMLCHYAECRILFIITLNVVMLSVVVP